MPPRDPAHEGRAIARRMRPGLRVALALLTLLPGAVVAALWPGSAPGDAAPAAPAVQGALLGEATPADRDRCREALGRQESPLLALADVTQTLVVDRRTSREANLSEENVLLLKSLGWVAGEHGNLTSVQDSTERVTLTCEAVQDVRLERDDVLAAVALEGGLGERPRVGDIARVTVRLTLTTLTTQRFHLDRETVLGALALSGGPEGFDPARMEEVATFDRASRTEEAFHQEVSLNPETTLAALAGSDRARRT